MRRIFWDRFTQSLLPPPKIGFDTDTGGGRELLVEGSKVHARYGSERGSYYAATVLGISTEDKGTANKAGGSAENGLARKESSSTNEEISTIKSVGSDSETGGVFVDVKYDEDGTVERGIPVSRLKKSGDPPDFGPLVSLLGEVCSNDAAVFLAREETRGKGRKGKGAGVIYRVFLLLTTNSNKRKKWLAYYYALVFGYGACYTSISVIRLPCIAARSSAPALVLTSCFEAVFAPPFSHGYLNEKCYHILG